MEQFAQLLGQRWEEAQMRLGIPGRIRLSWEITDDYPHFKTKRGYGVTFHNGKPACHMAYPYKMLKAKRSRQDGVLRHELGHVLDLCIRSDHLDAWALAQGIQLPPPHHAEVRADAIAEAVWGQPIAYDKDLVQTTGRGTVPRPRHLGL